MTAPTLTLETAASLPKSSALAVAIWCAVNEYARTCGGDPDKGGYGATARQRAVTAVVQAIDAFALDSARAYRVEDASEGVSGVQGSEAMNRLVGDKPAAGGAPTGPGWTLHKLYSVARTRAKSQDERYGQALFNTLVQIRPDIAERLRGSPDDPFYANGGDERAERAIAVIEAMWGCPCLQGSAPPRCIDGSEVAEGLYRWTGEGWTWDLQGSGQECEVCGTFLTPGQVLDGWTVHPSCEGSPPAEEPAAEYHAQGHMHTRYVCTRWPKGGERCGWSGWVVRSESPKTERADEKRADTGKASGAPTGPGWREAAEVIGRRLERLMDDAVGGRDEFTRERVADIVEIVLTATQGGCPCLQGSASASDCKSCEDGDRDIGLLEAVAREEYGFDELTLAAITEMSEAQGKLDALTRAVEHALGQLHAAKPAPGLTLARLRAALNDAKGDV